MMHGDGKAIRIMHRKERALEVEWRVGEEMRQQDFV